MEIAHIVLQLGGGVRTSILSLVLHASGFSKLVLLVLVLMSVATWAILWNRLRTYQAAERADRAFLEAFRRQLPGADSRLLHDQHPGSVLARVAGTGHRTLEGLSAELGDATRHELAERAMERRAHDEVELLEKHVGTLGTTGSVAPFIGLLGTVWGVMVSFVNIGAQGSATLAVVAPGIAEALIATIAGLAAAIPAVIAYNHCLSRLRLIEGGTRQFTSEWLDRRRAARRA